MGDTDDGNKPLPEDASSQLTYTNEENDLENRSNQSARAFDAGSQKSELQLTQDILNGYKEIVFKSRPNIANQYNLNKDTNFYDFSKRHIRENRNKIVKSRKQELIDTIEAHVRQRLGSNISQSVAKQLKTNDSVSTVQHSSPLSHPDSLNSILENSLPYFGSNNPAFKNVIVLACSGVSFNNTKFPRGHLFHSVKNNELYTNQITLFGHTSSARPVIFHAPYTYENIIEAKNSLQQLVREEKINGETRDKITSFLEDIYGSPHALSLDNYLDQLTVTNYWIFRSLFADYNKPVPSLVYLSQEKIVLELLTSYHLDKETVINKLLFESKSHSLIDRYYEGVTGAFSNEKKLGTYLFWALPKKSKYRLQLFRDGNVLRSDDNSYVLELTPQAVRKAIENNELIPSVMLTFWVLAMYYGLFLGGGYEQTFYLTQIKNKYSELLAELNLSDSDSTEGLVTTNLVIPRPLLTYLDGPNDMRIPATALDLLLYTDFGKEWYRLLESTKHVGLGLLIERTLPSIYREYVTDKTSADIFSKVTERDIEIFTGLNEKISPVASLS